MTLQHDDDVDDEDDELELLRLPALLLTRFFCTCVKFFAQFALLKVKR